MQGTGLLVSASFDPERIEVLGPTGIESWCRRHGLGVIHGGVNSLRFTPHFAITSAEVDLIVALVRGGIRAQLGIEGIEVRARELEAVPR